jgi:hypothetical protein
MLFGLQDFLKPESRKVPSRVLRATALMIAGLFLLYLYQTYRTSGNAGKAYGPQNAYGLGV